MIGRLYSFSNTILLGSQLIDINSISCYVRGNEIVTVAIVYHLRNLTLTVTVTYIELLSEFLLECNQHQLVYDLQVPSIVLGGY